MKKIRPLPEGRMRKGGRNITTPSPEPSAPAPFKPSGTIALPGGMETAGDSSVEMIIRYRTREEHERWMTLAEKPLPGWRVVRVMWHGQDEDKLPPGVAVLRTPEGKP